MTSDFLMPNDSRFIFPSVCFRNVSSLRYSFSTHLSITAFSPYHGIRCYAPFSLPRDRRQESYKTNLSILRETFHSHPRPFSGPRMLVGRGCALNFHMDFNLQTSHFSVCMRDSVTQQKRLPYFGIVHFRCSIAPKSPLLCFGGSA